MVKVVELAVPAVNLTIPHGSINLFLNPPLMILKPESATTTRYLPMRTHLSN